MSDAFDFVVIGGGSAGYAGARVASAGRLKVAVVEGGAEVGGLCILRGCMPSKTLLESANRFDAIRRAREFGLRAEGIAAVGEEIVERKRKLIGEFAKYRENQLEAGRFELIRGLASFVDPHTIEIRWRDEPVRRLTAKTFLISTGSRLKFIDVPGLRECSVLDSDRVLEATEIPKSIVVLGAGAISMEFAHYYTMLGTKVTIVQRSGQVLSGMDTDVAAAASEAMRKRGVIFHLGAQIQRMELCEGGKRVVFVQDQEEKSVEAEEVLYALGRRPHVDGLNLDGAGVVVANGRVRTGLDQATSAPHIFAAGDVTGPYEIVHIAIQQGEIAARNACGHLAGEKGPREEMDYRLKLAVIFTVPEVATVGMSERELTDAGVRYAVAAYPFDDHGKSMVMGEREGFVKLMVAEDGGAILGAAAVGPHASDLIHEIVVGMHFRARACDLAAIPHYHPTLSEIWTYPAEELAVHCAMTIR